MAYKLGFGKHKDRTLEWIFFHDPGYAWWMIDTGATKNLSAGPRYRFDELVRRAKSLRVPGTCEHCPKPVENMILTYQSGGLALVEFFCDSCQYGGAYRSYPLKPAFYTPDFFKRYDKLGAHFLISAIKRRYFPKKQRMTQTVMETFFNDPNNFVNF